VDRTKQGPYDYHPWKNFSIRETRNSKDHKLVPPLITNVTLFPNLTILPLSIVRTPQSRAFDSPIHAYEKPKLTCV
jgi:hypothetical protein